MDSGPMDQDIDTIKHVSYDSFASSDNWIDHVKWQGSQTACSALNQLIKSSVKETTRQDALRTSEWQRVPSYYHHSNLRSTGHRDTSSSSLLSSHSRPSSSSKPSSSSRSHSRARLSATAPDITNLPIPSFFNKTNPIQFLDIMKGVSARLDENAGVRPRKDFNSGAASSSSSRTKKRSRGLSFGSTSELQSGTSSCGILKKGRLDELRTSTKDEGKGKGRATSENEALDSEVKYGRGLQAHSSLPDMHSRSDLKRSLSSKDVSLMDVDDKDDDIDAEYVSQPAVSSSFDDGHERTLSQTEMPPPPLPYDSFTNKQRQPAAADPPSTLTPLSNSMPLLSSTPSSRPPPLGMRRTHTFPSRTPPSSSVRQKSSSLTGGRGQLPQRQKRFKPPLLSLSQPQAGTQPRTLDPPLVKANTDTSDCSRLNKFNQGMVERVAPELPDGDTDSSFGDMSFDMDALEETMKMYD